MLPFPSTALVRACLSARECVRVVVCVCVSMCGVHASSNWNSYLCAASFWIKQQQQQQEEEEEEENQKSTTCERQELIKEVSSKCNAAHRIVRNGGGKNLP